MFEIKQIKISNFKSIGSNQTISCKDFRKVIVYGKNGVGKSNVHTALRHLFDEKSDSLTKADMRKLIRFSQTESSVSVIMGDNESNNWVEVEKVFTLTKLVFKVDGVVCKQEAFRQAIAETVNNGSNLAGGFIGQGEIKSINILQSDKLLGWIKDKIETFDLKRKNIEDTLMELAKNKVMLEENLKAKNKECDRVKKLLEKDERKNLLCENKKRLEKEIAAMEAAEERSDLLGQIDSKKLGLTESLNQMDELQTQTNFFKAEYRNLIKNKGVLDEVIKSEMSQFKEIEELYEAKLGSIKKRQSMDELEKNLFEEETMKKSSLLERLSLLDGEITAQYAGLTISDSYNRDQMKDLKEKTTHLKKVLMVMIRYPNRDSFKKGVGDSLLNLKKNFKSAKLGVTHVDKQFNDAVNELKKLDLPIGKLCKDGTECYQKLMKAFEDEEVAFQHVLLEFQELLRKMDIICMQVQKHKLNLGKMYENMMGANEDIIWMTEEILFLEKVSKYDWTTSNLQVLKNDYRKCLEELTNLKEQWNSDPQIVELEKFHQKKTDYQNDLKLAESNIERLEKVMEVHGTEVVITSLLESCPISDINRDRRQFVTEQVVKVKEQICNVKNEIKICGLKEKGTYNDLESFAKSLKRFEKSGNHEEIPLELSAQTLDQLKSALNKVNKELGKVGSTVNNNGGVSGLIDTYSDLVIDVKKYLKQLAEVNVQYKKTSLILEKKDEEALKSFCKTTSNIFETITDGGRIRLKIEKVTIGDGLTENVGINVGAAFSSAGEVRSATAFSGGQESIIGLCFVFALVQLTGVPFLFLDEIDAPFDTPFGKMVASYLNELGGEKQMFITSFREYTFQIGDLFPLVAVKHIGQGSEFKHKKREEAISFIKNNIS
uniref:SMC_N domain-containing protein n=1 Tax=Rhabditophanes sp. KR3021 TaxID=114890 RepID=A0AC35TWG2_9BILA